MKNLRFVLMLAILVWIFPNVQAQYNPNHYDLDQNTVVAVNGLKMRSKPSLRGKIISKIPYGQQVDIIETSHYGHDTLSSNYKVYYTPEEFYEPLLSGYWVKVRHEGEEGYVFSGFLFYRFDPEYGYNRKTALLFEGSNCYDNLHYRPDWHWYGVYEDEGVQRIEKVKLDFLVEESDLGPLLMISTDKAKPSLFIVGSPRPLKERRLLFSEYLGSGSSIYRGGEVSEKILQDAALEVVDQEGENNPLIVAQGALGQQQILNPEESYFNTPITLRWYGDLDGDGEMDYLINFGEKSAKSILFLSTKAKEGQLVAPVGAYYSGYCC